MPHSRDLALQAGFYLAAAITGIAAAYVLNEWVIYLWDKPDKEIAPDEPPLQNNDQPLAHDESPARPLPNNDQPPIPPAQPLPSNDPPSLPPLRIDDLPPPLPLVHDILSPTSFGTHADEEQEPSDTGSFVQVLSPPAPRGLTRRRSVMRAHDLFAASHISFSELGSLVAPSDEQYDEH